MCWTVLRADWPGLGCEVILRRRARRLETDALELPANPTVPPERDGLWLLAIALALALLFHGVLLANQSYVRTYDALIHVFFGAHYAQSWFDPWEPRWYTGFSTVSYPPLSHQLIAVLSKVVGLKTAFGLTQLGAILSLTVGLYRFSRLLAPPRAAGYAAIVLVLSSSIAETVHVFGQLPTTLSLGFLLNGIPFAFAYLRTGEKVSLARAVAFMSATTAAHHVTTLFGSVFFTAPVIALGLLQAFRSPRPFEPSGEGLMARSRRRLYRLAPRAYRAGLVVGLTVFSLVLVVFPYWYWSRTDPILQVSIPHASRDSFIKNTAAGLMFFVIPWASTIWFAPYAGYKGLLTWRWPVAASLLALFVLGTGGTTPIPKMLLRGAFDILTLDRFTFWGTILILPFAGMALESIGHGRARAWFEANLGRRVRLAGLGLLVVSFVSLAVWVSTLTRYRPFQPEPINVSPIVSFIDKDEHYRYRYLTLGFGDQMAWLSANTRALTPDGNYHSARRLIELTTTPVERLDGAKYTGVPGIGSLDQFLSTPEKYNLKFVFSNDAFYDPLLYFSGWHRVNRLENGIVVWEREDIPPLPERLPRKSLPIYQRAMWGVLPPLALILAVSSLGLRRRASRRRRWQRWGLGARLLELLREDALPEVPASPWQPWRGLVRPLERVLNFRRRAARSRWVRVISIGLVSIGAFVSIGLHLRAPDKPEAAVLAYWDDVDFKRFDKAFTRLSPQGGLTLERHLLDLSVQGGLRSGYAKLDRIEPRVIAREGDQAHPRVGDRALVRTQLTWVTSLERIPEEVTQQLERTAQGWRILTWPLVRTRPRDRLTEEPNVSYYRAPRRLTTDATAAGDVLDRPRLAVISARLVRRAALPADPTEFDASGKPITILKGWRYSVVGELENVDARPADVTVTAILRDKAGARLAQNNVGPLMIHKLLPGERTPFRVDFTGPDVPKEPQAVKDFEVFAKAVVTSRDLSRSIIAWVRPDGPKLDGLAANVGTSEVLIPRALVSLFDARGLAWVDSDYLLASIPPRDRQAFSLEAKLPRGYEIALFRKPPPRDERAFDGERQTSSASEAAPLLAPGLEKYLIQFQGFEASP